MAKLWTSVVRGGPKKLDRKERINSDKLKSKGKHNMVIIAAIMRKLLHLCFAIIKTNTPFNFISKNL